MFIVALHAGLALWRLESGLRRFLPSPQRSDPAYVHHICGEGTGPLLSIAAKSGSQSASKSVPQWNATRSSPLTVSGFPE